MLRFQEEGAASETPREWHLETHMAEVPSPLLVLPLAQSASLPGPRWSDGSTTLVLPRDVRGSSSCVELPMLSLLWQYSRRTQHLNTSDSLKPRKQRSCQLSMGCEQEAGVLEMPDVTYMGYSNRAGNIFPTVVLQRFQGFGA